MSPAFWVCGAVTAISALVSFGYSVADLRSAPAGARTASMYAFSRSLGLAVVAIVALFTGLVPFVAAVAIAMILVQAGDAVIGAITRNRLKAVGPAATALVNLGVLIWMLAA